MSKFAKAAIIFIAVFTVAMIFVASARFFSGNEDGWLCANGQWVKHGNPSSLKPTSGCGAELTRDKVTQNNEVKDEAKIEEIRTADIRITSPKQHELVKSPLEIAGEARGTWYFEASFPITVLDDKGQTIGSAVAEAQGDWMTENFVPFKATLKFSAETSTIGTIMLRNDDPSGDVSKQKSVSIPVRFK